MLLEHALEWHLCQHCLTLAVGVCVVNFDIIEMLPIFHENKTDTCTYIFSKSPAPASFSSSVVC